MVLDPWQMTGSDHIYLTENKWLTWVITQPLFKTSHIGFPKVQSFRTSTFSFVHQRHETPAKILLYIILLMLQIFCIAIKIKKVLRKNINTDRELFFQLLCANRLSLNVKKLSL